MKSILFFDLRAAERRRIVKAVGQLDQFSNHAWRMIARDDSHAKMLIDSVQRAARASVRFLVTDEAAFAAGWGICSADAAFGGPFTA